MNEKSWPIPESILSEIRMMRISFDDYDRKIAHIKLQKASAQALMWLLLGDKIPAIQGLDNIALSDDWTEVILKNSGREGRQPVERVEDIPEDMP